MTVKCYRFTHEHFAGAHIFHVELEFKIVGKTEVSRKKNLSEQRAGKPTTNSTHIMVTLVLGQLARKSQFFHTNHILGTLDFQGSEH